MAPAGATGTVVLAPVEAGAIGTDVMAPVGVI
jgi:hypothetical protein